MNTQKPYWLMRVAAFALALSVFTACDDSTSPGNVDAVQTAQTMDAVVTQFIDGNDAAQSLNVFSGLMAGAIGGGSPAIAALDMLPRSGSPFAAVRRVQLGVAELAGGEPAKLPVGVLGTTFVYNSTTNQYEPDFQRTGAPTNGVRFILYAVDPILEQPIDPLTEIGWIDIIDTSNFPTINVSLEAVVSGVTLIDVAVSGTFGQTTVTVDFSGTLSDGTDDLTFSIDALVDMQAETFDITFGLSTGTLNVSFVVDADATGVNLVVTLTDGGDTIVLTFALDDFDNVLTGSGITFNGTPVAIISGTVDDPVITNTAGDPLTAEELTALEDLFNAVNDMGEFFFGMFEFAFFLIMLGAF